MFFYKFSVVNSFCIIQTQRLVNPSPESITEFRLIMIMVIKSPICY
jgi:hypothetical protein